MSYLRPIDRQDCRPLALDRPHSAANKLLGLELLRFGAALAVLLNHYRFLAQKAGAPPFERGEAPFLDLLWPFYNYGHYGVELFWGISGYIFFWKYGAAIHSRAVSTQQFFWLRFSRLYPLHLVTLLAVVALQAVHRQVTGSDFIYPSTDIGDFVRQLFLATDWGPPVAHSFNGPIWSISAEIAVYAGFFLLLRKFAPSARLCISVVGAGLALQLAGMGWASIGCATYFFAGGLATMAPNWAARPAGATLAGLLLLCASTDVLDGRNMMPLVLLAAVPCLLVLASQDWAIFNRWQRTIQAAGNLTYSTYLLHFPMQLLLLIGVAATSVRLPVASPIFLIGYVAAILTIAAASYRLFELPAQQWLRQLTLRKAAIA